MLPRFSSREGLSQDSPFPLQGTETQGEKHHKPRAQHGKTMNQNSPPQEFIPETHLHQRDED